MWFPPGMTAQLDSTASLVGVGGVFGLLAVVFAITMRSLLAAQRQATSERAELRRERDHYRDLFLRLVGQEPPPPPPLPLMEGPDDTTEG